MRKVFITVAVAGVLAAAIWAADWPAEGGSPQREGWARGEKAFTVENARSIELLYRYKAENPSKGLNSLTAPIVNGMLITYLGFKEMLVFGGSGDNVFSVDADLNRIIWRRHFDAKAAVPGCSSGLSASLAMPGSSAAVGRGGPAGRGLFATGFGRSGVFIAVASDGFLHALNTSTGEDKAPPVRFVPAGSKVGALNINDSVVYATTADGCGGAPGVYALDMAAAEAKLSSYATGRTPATGTAIGSTGTVYVQTDSVHALSKDLQAQASSGPMTSEAVPMVFSWKGRDVVVAGGDAALALLDGASLSPLAKAEAPGAHFRGGFSSWEDAGTRWIYASTAGSVTGFKLAENNGALALTSVWTASDIVAPGATVTANGLVFVLSSGEPSGHAVLHVLDGATGKELYSSGRIVTTFAHNPALAIANRRIYFTTHDNTVYAFGFMAEQPQLTGK